MADIIQIRRDTSTNWFSVNPILNSGEMGYETNTYKFKFGNGTSRWNVLPYALDTANQEVFSGTVTINFGATPTDETTLAVTGLGNMTTTANIHCYIIGDDTTADNTADDHDTLSYHAICSATTRVVSTGFTVVVRMLSGFAVGTYKIHYTYTL